MPIISLQTIYAGVASHPHKVSLLCNDDYATITTAGYINRYAPGAILDSGDFVFANYDTDSESAVMLTVDIDSSGTISLLPPVVSPGIITNADVAANAAISFSKLAALLSTKVLVGSAGNVATAVTMTGDVTISNTGVTTVAAGIPRVTTPTIANHIATYTDTSGDISKDPATAITAGNLQAGLSGTAGYVTSFPAPAATGSFSLVATDNEGNYANVITHAGTAQATIWTLPDAGTAAQGVNVSGDPLVHGNLIKANGTGGLTVDAALAANQVLTSSINNPDISIDLISFDVTVGQAALAAAGSVILITSGGSRQYKIRSLQLNSGGTNFSGGSGDRLGQVTDGTTVYSVVPAATMQALTNAQWGVTALPNPASAALNTSTSPAANLVFKYSGGTLDYTAGSLRISGIAQRVV